MFEKIAKKKIFGAVILLFLLQFILTSQVAYGTPSIDSVSPVSGCKGDVIVVSGSMVTPSAVVNLYWDSLSSWNGESGLVNTASADPDGSYEVSFQVPEAVNGPHYIWVMDTVTGSTAMFSTPFEVSACLVLTPDVGLPGDVVTLNCYGFSDEADIESVTFDGVSIATSPGSMSTDDMGSCSMTFRVPNESYGVYEVSVIDSSSVSAVAYFTIGPTIALDVTSGPVGTLITVQGRGFSASIPIDAVSLGGITCGIIEISISEDGTLFTGKFIVPTVDAVGTYDVVVTDSMSYSGSASFYVTDLSVLVPDPMYGVPGSLISVSGGNFSALEGEIVTLELRDVTTSDIYDLGVTAPTDADGEFTTTFMVPAMSFAEYRLVARQDYWNIVVETPFYIKIVAAILDPTEGPVDLEVTLTAIGFTDSESWEAFFGEEGSVTSGTVSIGGTIIGAFNVPNVAPGVYPVVVIGHTSGISVTIDFTVTPPPSLNLTLRIEDAAEGVIVNKLGGDVDGPVDFSFVDVVADLESSTDEFADDVPVVLTVPGDIFGNPTDTWVRDTSGSTFVPVAYTELESGKYEIEADLILSEGEYRKQIVWRFRIRDTVSPQDVEVSAEIPFPCNDPDGMATIRVIQPGIVDGIFITNRVLMYQNYVHDDVTELLNRIYEEAQGAPLTNSPLSVIYYVERYDNDVLNWDNTNVNYASETTANVVSNRIDGLIEDWEEDATLFELICFPLNCIVTEVASPEYLLIVGDDQDIPFYRYEDPSGHEGITLFECDGVWPPEHPGWCIDSNAPPNVEPAVWATDNNFILTDNVYADLDPGTSWMIGELEMSIGRILGETAVDMLNLFENGVSRNNRRTGNVVMASVDGWELGLEPHVGLEVADLHNVSALFIGKRYEVRNDDSPFAEVRTIDVMDPYEGGNNNWNTNFRNAANNVSGMDLFFIGGHNSYDRANIPGNDFVPADTPGIYTRFGIDHPVAMIVGCHGGLPVRTGGGLFGGANNDMVYDLAHEGASAYIGATGFSYGSPNDLHDCTWAERMFQIYFDELLSTPPLILSFTSNSIGSALKEAKENYISPAGGWDSLDNKTVTEFNLYGVPWAFYRYPRLWIQVIPDLPSLIDVTVGTVAPWDVESYKRSYIVDLGLHDIEAMTYDDVTYDLFTVQGGLQAIGDGNPVLPYVEVFTLELPVEGKITGVIVSTNSSKAPGTYNIPIAVVNPFSMGGISYTNQTDINYLYPRLEDLVNYQETNEGLLFTLSPVQYNPFTDEVIYHESFTIDVIYESPLPIGVREVIADKSVYVPGDTVGTSTTIVNVGSSEVTLTAVLTFMDSFGKVMGSRSSGEFTVPSGDSYDVEIDWIQVLGEGIYLAEDEVSLGDSLVGASSTRILMIGDGVNKLKPPSSLRVGESGEFVVECVNYGDDTISREVSLTILDSPGEVIIVNLPSKTITVEAGGKSEAVFSWTPEISTGNYIAVASVGATYLMESFTVFPEEVDSALVTALERITTLEALLEEGEIEIGRLTGELEVTIETVSDLETQVQDLTEAIESQQELAGRWQQFTYYATAVAGVLLLLLLFYARK
jgi:hypothetical protein